MSTRVTTASGPIAGEINDGIHVFRGIPYAAAPTGANRFRPPQPVQPWIEIREAITYAPSCPQGLGSRPGGPALDIRQAAADVFGMPLTEQRQDEDCLALNVWTPAVGDAGRRPVMVRIHGGGYSMGSGSWTWHDGTNLARRGDVVVVTVNHRLGVLGFLHLDGVGGDRWAGSGNAGMLDLVAALEWVRDNIGAFGGDPDNVTIFGESGGGMKVSTLLAMPAARGLFQRAIVQSGPALRARTREAANALTGQLLAAVGVPLDHLERLVDVPTQALLDAQIDVLGPGVSTGLGPVLDPGILPVHPIDALRAGAASHVPLMTGWSRHEVSMFWALEGAPELDDDGLRRRLRPALGDSVDAAVDCFRRLHPHATDTQRYLLAQSLVMFGVGTLSLAAAQAAAAGDVYVYLLAWESPVEDGRLGAAHGMCVPLTMDNAHTTPYSDQPVGHALADTMSETWLAFARTGKPNHAGIPYWPPYNPQRPTVMVFDETSHIAHDPLRVELDALSKSTFTLS